jgi:hypothetical protein
VITTDTPLLFFLALMIWAYVACPRLAPARLPLAAGMGAALGLAFLSKYAAIYALASLAAHLACRAKPGGSGRRPWRSPSSPPCRGLRAQHDLELPAPLLDAGAHRGQRQLERQVKLFNIRGADPVRRLAVRRLRPRAVRACWAAGRSLLALRKRLARPTSCCCASPCRPC